MGNQKKTETIFVLIYMCRLMLWWMWRTQLYLSQAVIISARGGAVIHCSTYCIGNHNRKGARGNPNVAVHNFFLQQMKHIHPHMVVEQCCFLLAFILHVHNSLEMEAQPEHKQEKPVIHFLLTSLSMTAYAAHHS